VAFHLRSLAAGSGAAAARSPQALPPRASPLSAVTKNRRLAYVDTLQAAGFFSEQAMRSRCAHLALRARCVHMCAHACG
jgi:hypothetical protein